MRFKERRSDAFSVKDETKVAIGDEWQDRTVLSYYSSSAMSSTLSHLHFFYTRRSNTSRESRAIRAADRAAALFSKWDRVTGFISLTLSLVIS
jgi:hypothetical protein